MGIEKSSSEGFEKQKAWRVLEQSNKPKDLDQGSEDAYFVTDNCIAVLDGVSSVINAKDDQGHTPAQFAVWATEDIFRDPSTDSRNVVARLTSKLRESLAARVGAGNPSFVFVAFFPKENVIVRVGDCSYLIDGEGENHGLNVDYVRGILRKRAIEKARTDGKSDDSLLRDDPMKSEKQRLRDWQDHFPNNPSHPEFGYGLIDGTDVPAQYVEYISVPEGAKTVLLASDGYPPAVLRESLSETEAALIRLQQEDPLGVRDVSIRPHQPVKPGQTATDDRTYVRISR